MASFDGDVSRIFVFDSLGNAGQVLTLPSSEDGSASGIALSTDLSDSLYVFDNLSLTLFVYSPTLKLVRTDRFASGWIRDAVRLKDGRYLVSADIHTTKSIGFPLHILDASARLISSFGAPDTAFVAGALGQNAHILRQADDGSIWSTPEIALRLTQWDDALSAVEVVTFEGGNPDSFTRKPARPDFVVLTPAAVDVDAQACGRLMVLSHIPATVDLGDPGVSVSMVSGRRAMKVRFPDRTMQSVVDVVDGNSGTYLASYLMPANLNRLLPHSRALSVATDAEGHFHTTLVRIRLNGQMEAAATCTRR